MLLLFRLFLLVALSAFSAYSSQAQSLSIETSDSSSSKKLKLSSDFFMGGMAYNEAQDEAHMVSFSMRPKASLALTSSFGVRGDTQLNLTSGRSQSRFYNPNFNFINIQELVAYYHPSSYFQMEVGALNQASYGSPLFISNRSFPGLRLRSRFGNKRFKLTPKAEYSIPTSTSLESQRTQAEKLPTLTSVGVEAEAQLLKSLSLQANINRFQFSQLPSIVAFDSSRFGNSVIGTDPSLSFFRYQFAGWVQSYSASYHYTPSLKQSWDIQIIENTEAPEDRRRSQSVGSQLEFDFTHVSLKPGYRVFYAESDSTPAIYSEFELGRNNRQGEQIDFTVHLKKLGVSMVARYTQATLIENRPLQSDMQIFNLALEFNNVAL